MMIIAVINIYEEGKNEAEEEIMSMQCILPGKVDTV